MNTPIDRAMDSIANVVTFNGALGDYSIGLHVTFIVGAMLVLAAAVIAIVKIRGQGDTLIAVCTKDITVAIGCAILVFAFPGYFYFMGRAFWRAVTWSTEVITN